MRASFPIILSLLLLSCTFADPPADIGGRELSDKSSIDEVLDALDARGHDFKTFTANIKHTDSDLSFGDDTVKTGKAIYQDLGNGNARIRVSFDTSQHNDKTKKERNDYELIDGKLIERHYATTSQTTTQVIRPGQKIDLFKLGQGPFPLPIGQPKEEVHKQFAVKKVDPGKDDPSGTVHIELTPVPDTRMARKFKWIQGLG